MLLILKLASTEIGHQNLQKAGYLNVVINETLRLHFVMPSALHRKTPPEGIMVGNAFIGGNMTVRCPQYTIFRDEDYYARAEESVPERWSSKPDMIKDTAGYALFLAGKSCSPRSNPWHRPRRTRH